MYSGFVLTQPVSLRLISDQATDRAHSQEKAVGMTAVGAAKPSGRASSFMPRLKFLNMGARLNLARFSHKLLASVWQIDGEDSGKVTPTELFAALAAANIGMSEHEFDQLTAMLERAGDGLVDVHLLVQVLEQLTSDYNASKDAQHMPGGEMLAFSVKAPVSKDAVVQGVWPVANSPPGIRRERRVGIVTPWAERVALSLQGMTATQASQRKWRETHKHEEPDYRWPALPAKSKSRRQYQVPRSATPRAKPWPSPADAFSPVRQQTPPDRRKRRQQSAPQQRDPDRPLSRGEAATLARAQVQAKRAARDAAIVKLERQQMHTSRAVSPYSLTPSVRLRKELLYEGQRRPHSANTLSSRPVKSLSAADFDGQRPTPAKIAGKFSPRLASPVGIYLPSSCGPAPSLDVPPAGAHYRRRAYPRRFNRKHDLPPAAQSVSLAMPQSSSGQLEDEARSVPEDGSTQVTAPIATDERVATIGTDPSEQTADPDNLREE